MSKVLVVDDDGPIRDFLKIHFEGPDLTAQKILFDAVGCILK